MKRLLFLSFVALSVSGFSQSSFVVRPGLGNPEFTDGSGKEVVSGSVSAGQLIRVTVPVYNNSFAEVVRAGSGSLEVDLGSVAAGGLEVVELPQSGVFSWGKAEVRGGHSYVTGRLVSNLGASYSGSEIFVLRSSVALDSRLRVRWIDSTPARTKRSDVSAEIQVRVVNNQVNAAR